MNSGTRKHLVFPCTRDHTFSPALPIVPIYIVALIHVLKSVWLMYQLFRMYQIVKMIDIPWKRHSAILLAVKTRLPCRLRSGPQPKSK